MWIFKLLLKILLGVALALIAIVYIVICIKYLMNIMNNKSQGNDSIERILPIEAVNRLWGNCIFWILN